MSDYKKDFEKSIDFIEWQNDMLKKQADRIADLETTLAFKKMKPLSDDEIEQVWEKCKCENQKNVSLKKIMMYMAKAIEERHGIK